MILIQNFNTNQHSKQYFHNSKINSKITKFSTHGYYISSNYIKSNT